MSGKKEESVTGARKVSRRLIYSINPPMVEKFSAMWPVSKTRQVLLPIVLNVRRPSMMERSISTMMAIDMSNVK